MNYISSKNILLIFFCVLASCKNEKTLTVYSPDRTQSLIIKDRQNEKHIYVKENSSESNSSDEIGYVKFNMENVSNLGDAIFICWRNIYELEILCPKAQIITNTLDANSYRISTVHKLDSLGIPKVRKYHQRGCFELGYTQTIIPKGEAHIIN